MKQVRAWSGFFVVATVLFVSGCLGDAPGTAKPDSGVGPDASNPGEGGSSSGGSPAGGSGATSAGGSFGAASGAGGRIGAGGTSGAGGDASGGVSGADGGASPDGGVSPDGGTGPKCMTTELLCDGACVPNDIRNCGECGHDCSNLKNVTGKVDCVSGVCTFSAGACKAGYANCSKNPDTGCDTSVTSKTDCGTCGQGCSGGTPVCAASGMSYACESGCPAATPTLCSGSTCVNTASDADNCGMCGKACTTTVAGATPTCAMSKCGFQCTASYPDSCAGGCVDFKTDAKNCGKCGTPCVGNQQCIGGTCQCTGGTHLCGNTCVLNDINACGASCAQCQAPSGGSATCNGTSCGKTCSVSGNSVCNNACVNVQGSDNANCGACGKPCSTSLTSAVAQCSGGSCQVSCSSASLTMCSTGCFDLQSAQHNCGRCNHDCFNGTCSGGKCQPWVVAQPPTTTNVTGLASDGTSVIWADKGAKAVYQINYAGTGKITLASDASFTTIAPPQSWPMALAGGTVAWATSDHVWTAKLGTASSGKQFPFAFSGGSGLRNVAINPAATYVGVTYTNGSGSLDIYDCALAGTTCGNTGSGIAAIFALGAVATASSYYMVNTSGASIDSHAFGSLSIGHFKTGLGTPTLLAMDSNNFYWWNAGSGGGVARVSLLGGSVANVMTQFDSTTTFLIGLATDGTNVYATTQASPSALVYGPVGGCCAATTLATGSNPSAVVAAGSKVFWVDGNAINAIAAP